MMMADEQIGLSARGAVTQPYVYLMYQPPGTSTGYSPAAKGCKGGVKWSRLPPRGSRCAKEPCTDIAEVKYLPTYLPR